MAACEVRYRDLVPMLRLRGHWLARLGFKQGMRVYIVATAGALVITATDPAKMRKQSGAQSARVLATAAPLAPAAPQRQEAGALAVSRCCRGVDATSHQAARLPTPS
jgi:hypothetical protein